MWTRRRGIPTVALTVAVLSSTVALALPASHRQSVAHAARSLGSARPDPSFGGGRGWVTTGLRGLETVAYAATIAPAGRIVIAGQATDTHGHGQIVVARYLPNGHLDRAFASRGIFKTSLPTATGPYIGLAVRPQGRKLIVGGGYGLGSMLVMRLTASGRLDRTFGARHIGYTTIAVGGTAESLVVARSGAILLGSSNANANGRPMVVARLTAGGRLDRGFGRGGLAQAAFWNLRLAASAGVTGLAVTRDGGVIGAGHLDYIGSDGHGSAGIIRLSPRGRQVTSFGTQRPCRGRVYEARRRFRSVVSVRPHRRRPGSDHHDRRRFDEPRRRSAERTPHPAREARPDVRHRGPGEHAGAVRLQRHDVRRHHHAGRCADRRRRGHACTAPRPRSAGPAVCPRRGAANSPAARGGHSGGDTERITRRRRGRIRRELHLPRALPARCRRSLTTSRFTRRHTTRAGAA